MLCPRDQKELIEHRSGALDLHACEECGGAFVKLNQKGFPALSGKLIRPGSRPRVPIEESDRLLSPVTGQRMLVFRYRGVEIDYCAESNSIWLDPGELENAAASAPAAKSSRRKRGRSSGDSNPFLAGIDAALVSESVLDLLGEAVSALFDAW